MNRHSLHLGVVGTLLDDLPVGLFAPLASLSQLSVDLRGNRLSSLSPAVIYTNATDWQLLGTRVASGGLMLSDNPWVCDCGMAWLGMWQRRWLRETLQLHTAPLDVAQHVLVTSREPVCTEPSTGRQVPILSLYPSCQASALSQAPLSKVSLLSPTALISTTLFLTVSVTMGPNGGH
ncbi:leucine-rich repeat-containing protein 26-like [Macrosteles quadrilineatus]|uniref:leucine-rich repeat-containing protein 26-like n=1 Tax=Macrosteles quadrilineatus TaxID=74068 RepID=UPI0023E3448D|nr:leucine-rich repeat-containing protein 26-like [Macrosteles quadrilineatus]